jgi:antitoxin component of MazEF toxin-antitoxin module
MELQLLANKKKLVYYAKISKMGSKKMVIIPKAYWDDIKDLEEEKQIKITLEGIED